MVGYLSTQKAETDSFKRESNGNRLSSKKKIGVVKSNSGTQKLAVKTFLYIKES